MTMAIGVRYLTFQTIYGLKSYWVLGGVLAFTGLAIFSVRQPMGNPASIIDGAN